MDSAPPAPYGTASWRAMGTYAQVVVGRRAQLEAALEAAVQSLADVDRACSRYRPDSDLVRANAQAGRWTKVHPLLITAVSAALKAAHDSEDLFDPTVLDSGAGPADEWRSMGVDPSGAIRVPHGVILELGTLGRALAADVAAQVIAEDLGTDCLLSIGGDVAVGVATQASVRWGVGVRNSADGEVTQTVVVERGGLAGSYTTGRRGRRRAGGQSPGDPAATLPAAPTWRAVSIVAQSCVAAAAASMAAIKLDSDARVWLDKRDLTARLVSIEGGRVLRVGGWPEPG